MLPDNAFLAVSDRQDLYSMAYVRAIIAASGFNFGRSELDRNSDDLSVEFANRTEIDSNYSRLILQVKCTYVHLPNADQVIPYPLKIKNYNDLRRSMEPMILVVVVVPGPPNPWIELADEHTIFRYKAYWSSLYGLPDKPDQDTVTVYVPTMNIFDVNAVCSLMEHMVIEGNKEYHERIN